MQAAALTAAVEERLTRTVFTASGNADVRVRGGIQQRGGRWQVEIELSSAAGEPMGSRSLESDSADCSALDDSIALVLAVMLDIPQTRIPSPAAAPPTQTPAQQQRPAPPASLSSRLKVPTDTPPRRPSWHFELGLGGVLSVGLVPAAAWGLRAHLALTPPALSKFGLDVTIYRSVDEALEGSSAGASFSPLEAGFFVCPLDWELYSVDLEACAAQQVGRLRVRGYGFDTNQEQTRTYVNLGVELTASILVVGPLTARLGVRLQAPLVRETFRYGSPGGEEPSIFRMSPLVTTGQMGLSAEF